MASPHDSQPDSTSLPEQAPGSIVDSAGEPAVESVAAPARVPRLGRWR